jgi:MYXO-CTERM domain-containing protein
VLAALPLVVWAHGGLAPDIATDRFEPILQEDLLQLQDVTVDTGWLPASSPVQLRLYVHAADTIDIGMPGEARYDWSAEAIAVHGDVDAGWFTIDIGAEIEASVRFDVAGIQWESDLLGPYDFAIVSEAMFTPYLLPGSAHAPVTIEDATDGVTVAQVPIVPDIVVASGGLDIDVAASVSGALASLRVDATTAQGTTGTIAAEGATAPLPADAGPEALQVDGVLVSSLQATPTIIVRPHLVMSILGQDYEIAGIDIPVALPPIDDELVFAPEPLTFARPTAPGEDDGGDDTESSGGADDRGDAGEGAGDGASEDDGGPAEGAGDTSGVGESSDSGGASTESADGCGCSTAGERGRMMSVLLLGVSALARRRRARGTA